MRTALAGQLTGLKYGNGIYASFGFSSDRLQLNCLDYSTTNRNGSCAHDGTTIFGLNYSYGAAGSNNGQISGITDSVDNGRSIGFSYDSLYRLISAATAGSANYPAWGLSETYDRYGNRTVQTVTQGTGPSSSITVSATTNQLVGSPYAYDASGDMTNDGVNTLTYDGEGRAVSASGSLGSGAYVYDGNGLRVEKCLPNCSNPSTSAAYIFSGSKVIAQYDAWTPGIAPLTAEYVYSGSALLARVGSVDVRFTNDACCTGGDRNLFINSVTVGSAVINPTDPSVSYTVPTCNGNGGLYCDGDLVTVSDAGRSATSITVNAWGSPNNNVYPHMQLLVGGVVVGQWDVTGTAQNYTVTLPTTAAHYYHQDHLSNRIVTDSSGSVVEQLGHFPFGESWYNGSAEKWFFTTYERDSESGNDYAMARYHVSRLGRLSSPDPLAGSIADPQSLNRYAYSINDPANATDPSGLWPCTFAESHPSDGSQGSSSSHGGPSADMNDTDGAANGGGQGGCSGTLSDFIDAGLSLDGFDITDTGGGEGMGFPIGGGDPGQIAGAATTPTGAFIEDNPRWPSPDCILADDCGDGTFITGLVYGNLDALALLGGNTNDVNITQAKKDAKHRVLDKAKCRNFVANLLGKLYGKKGSSPSRIALRIDRERVVVSSVPNAEFPNAGAVTMAGTYNVTLYPLGYAPGVDLAEELIHEAFHVSSAGRDDIQILNSLVPSLRLPQDPKAAMDLASELWDPFLNADCGSD